MTCVEHAAETAIERLQTLMVALFENVVEQ